MKCLLFGKKQAQSYDTNRQKVVISHFLVSFHFMEERKQIRKTERRRTQLRGPVQQQDAERSILGSWVLGPSVGGGEVTSRLQEGKD